MPYDLNQLAADDTAYLKQASVQPKEPAAPEQQSFLQRWTAPIARVTMPLLDSAVSEADQWGTAAKRVGQDAAAGVTTAAVNTADALGSAITTSGRGLAMAEDPAHADAALQGQFPISPIWDHAKASILDFRDAIAVKDPNIVDSLAQAGAQLAVPFAGYSRALSSIHGFANMIAAGAITDATALAAHDPRMADLVALGKHTEGKLGEVLRALMPDGSAQNAYISYLTDRGNESEAEGRFKNILDGFGANLITVPLLTAAATVLKQGGPALRYAAENFGPGPVGPAAQRGHIQLNASGESAASLEAINRMKAEKKAGITRHVLRADDTVEPLIGPEAVDAKAYGRDVIIQMQDGEPTVLSRGPGVPEGHVQGRITRALENGTLPGATVTIGPQTVKKFKSEKTYTISSLKDLEK